MKFATAFALFAAQAALVSANPRPRDETDVITPWNNVPLEKRACWHGKPFGCSKSGYCWMSCGTKGSGTWCWLARDGGKGAWEYCGKGTDVNSNDKRCENVWRKGYVDCGRYCKKGDKSCGCSC